MKWNEEYVLNLIKTTLAKTFNTNAWKKLFGGKKIKFTDDDFGVEPSFPVIYIAIDNAMQADNTYDNSQLEKYTTFHFTIECYNQEITGKTKRELGVMLNSAILESIQTLMNPHIISNKRVESPDDTVYRRIITGYSIINNETKIFYR